MATARSTTRTAPARRTEPLRLPRTTGALSGLLVIILGVWGGLIPFIGPYFHYSFGGDQTWHFTMQRLWLDILPGAVAVLGGFMLLTASSRIGGLTGGWIALAAGAWFAIGPAVSLLWDQNIYAIGAPHGGSVRRMLEWVGYFHGLGVAIVGLSAFAMGRYFSRPRVVDEAAVAAADAEAAGRAGPRRTAAVADAPAAREPVTDREPVTERAPVTDRAPVTERTPVTDREPVTERAPATETRAADAPTERATAADAPAEPVTEARAADAPAEAAPARTTYGSTTGAGPTSTGAGPGTQTAAPRRRSGGLISRFRRR
jgi:hypothetical protein